MQCCAVQCGGGGAEECEESLHMQGSGRGGCVEAVYCVEAGDECVPSDTTQPPQPLHRL